MQLFCILKCNCQILNCNFVTQDRFWRLSTGVYYYNDHHCKYYGSDYLSIHQRQDIQDTVDLARSCHKYDIYIGLEVSQCFGDNNFTLKWSDDTMMNYSYINWCNGYPIDLCSKSLIYFNSSASCFRNDYDKKRPAICGNPYQC